MGFLSPKLLVLAVVVAVVGFACGGDDATPTVVPAPTSVPTAVPASPTAAPSTAPTAAPPPAVAPTAAPSAAPQPASLEIRVTDAPPDGVTKILLTVENIEVNVAENFVGSGWETVVEGPMTFDLVAVTGIEEILGSAELPPGRYNQIRLQVTEALITVEGAERSAILPSGRLRVVGGFDVVPGETTVLTLDFDAARSVVLRGSQGPILKPVVKLLVRRSGQPMSAAQTVSDGVRSGEPLIAGESVVTLGSSKDNTLFQSDDRLNSNGAGMGLFVGRTTRGELRRGLIGFELSEAIPAGATITDVSLRLFMSKTVAGSQPIALHRAQADWGEGASDGNANEGSGTRAEPGDATWIHRFFETDTWDTPGGDFAEAASATADVVNAGDYFWGASSDLVADVQEWVDDPSSNFGWVIIGNEEENRTTKRFDTKESGDGANTPALSVTFTLPPQQSPTPVPTATPTPQPAPTATSVPATGSGDGVGAQDNVEIVREINVVLTNFAITPNVIQIQAGEKVRFNVTNMSGIFHTFTFDLGGQRVSVDLLGGQTGTTDVLTFDAPATNPFWCVPHQSIGMTGTMTVGDGGSGGTTTTTSSTGDDGY